MKKLPLFASAAFILSSVTGCINVTNSLENPEYKILEKSGDIEIRDYKPYIVAEVKTEGKGDDAANKSFRMLADYIFGNNTVKKDIKMTAPVEVQENNKEIAMTAPVEVSDNKGEMIMRFSMPSEFNIETLPKPNNDKINIYKIEAYKAAVIRFTWLFTEKRFKEKSNELREFIKSKGYTEISEPVKAYYNPPFTIPFLKRNEVIIKVK